MAKAGLLGIDKVMSNLTKEVRKIKARSTVGLIEASIIIRRDMDKRPPLIPVDLGNLRASWFTTIGTASPEKGGTFKGKDSGKMSGDHGKALGGAKSKAASYPYPVLIMGFSASYSIPIHEMDFTKGNRPGSGPKFFESAIKRNHKAVLAAIKKNVSF